MNVKDIKIVNVKELKKIGIDKNIIIYDDELIQFYTGIDAYSGKYCNKITIPIDYIYDLNTNSIYDKIKNEWEKKNNYHPDVDDNFLKKLAKKIKKHFK